MLNCLEPVDVLLKALSEPPRRRMVERLARGPCSVSALTEAAPMSLPAVMQHLAVLEGAKLVETSKAGRVRTVSLRPDALRAVEDWAIANRRLWERKLDHLGDYLRETKQEGT
jgi:DNA-binding transcriptional ArsR family regulator